MSIIYDPYEDGYVSPKIVFESICQENKLPSERARSCFALVDAIQEDLETAKTEYLEISASVSNESVSALIGKARILCRKQQIEKYHNGDCDIPQLEWFTKMFVSDPFDNLLALTDSGKKYKRDAETGKALLTFSDDKINNPQLLKGEEWDDRSIIRTIQGILSGDKNESLDWAFHKYNQIADYSSWFMGESKETREIALTLGIEPKISVHRIPQQTTEEVLKSVFEALARFGAISQSQFEDFDRQIRPHFSGSNARIVEKIDWQMSLGYAGSLFTALAQNEIVSDSVCKKRPSYLEKHFLRQGNPINRNSVMATMAREKDGASEKHEQEMLNVINPIVRRLGH